MWSGFTTQLVLNRVLLALWLSCSLVLSGAAPVQDQGNNYGMSQYGLPPLHPQSSQHQRQDSAGPRSHSYGGGMNPVNIYQGFQSGSGPNRQSSGSQGGSDPSSGQHTQGSSFSLKPWTQTESAPDTHSLLTQTQSAPSTHSLWTQTDSTPGMHSHGQNDPKHDTALREFRGIIATYAADAANEVMHFDWRGELDAHPNAHIETLEPRKLEKQGRKAVMQLGDYDANRGLYRLDFEAYREADRPAFKKEMFRLQRLPKSERFIDAQYASKLLAIRCIVNKYIGQGHALVHGHPNQHQGLHDQRDAERMAKQHHSLTKQIARLQQLQQQISAQHRELTGHPLRIE